MTPIPPSVRTIVVSLTLNFTLTVAVLAISSWLRSSDSREQSGAKSVRESIKSADVIVHRRDGLVVGWE